MCKIVSLTALGRCTLIALALLWLYGSTHSVAGGMTRQEDRTLAIAVDDARPVAAALDDLEARYGWVLTYEDPPYVHASEIADVTESVRRDGRAKPRVLVPRGGAFTFNYAMSAGEPVPRPSVLLDALVRQHNTSGNPGRFRLVDAGAAWHVVPSASSGASGSLAAVHSPLDTEISIPDGSRTALEMIERIAAETTRSSGTPVALGIVPLNLLLQTTVSGGARNEMARSVLLRTLAATNQPLSWRMFYGPGSNRYALSIHIVKRRAIR